MKRFKRYMMVIGVLASSFAGGAVSHWILSDTSQAHAARKTSTKETEDSVRWTFAKPVFTRKLTVGQPSTRGGKIVDGKAVGTIDGTGMKLYDSSGKTRVRLDSATGGMALADTGGKDRVKFGTVQGGDTGVMLMDSAGRRRIQLADDADDFLQFLHQIGFVLQAPGRIDDQDVGSGGARLFDGIEGEAGGVRSGGAGDHRTARPVTPNL